MWTYVNFHTLITCRLVFSNSADASPETLLPFSKTHGRIWELTRGKCAHINGKKEKIRKDVIILGNFNIWGKSRKNI